MNGVQHWKGWLRIALVIAFSSLATTVFAHSGIGLFESLSTAPIDIEDGAARFAAPFAAVDVVCEIPIEDEDAYMAVESVDVSCPALAVPEFRRVDFIGNVGWARVVVGDEVVLRVYLQNEGVWRRYAYSPELDLEAIDASERENADLAPDSPNPSPASAGFSGMAVVSEAEWSTDLGRGISVNTRAALMDGVFAGAWPIATGSSEDLARESLDLFAGTGRAVQSADAARGSSRAEATVFDESAIRPYTAADLVFSLDGRASTRASAGPDLTPMAHLVPPSLRYSRDIDQMERELTAVSGSSANTLADLLAEMLGSAWPGQAAGAEDLWRETE
jgi:hypothetical protein